MGNCIFCGLPVIIPPYHSHIVCRSHFNVDAPNRYMPTTFRYDNAFDRLRQQGADIPFAAYLGNHTNNATPENDKSDTSDTSEDDTTTTTYRRHANQQNREFTPKEQDGETCYANAIAATYHLAMSRIIGRRNGIPDFDTIRKDLTDQFGNHGAVTANVLTQTVSKYRLHFKTVTEDEARKAVVEGRPVVATFRLDGKQWSNFSRFYEERKSSVLEKQDLLSMYKYIIYKL